MARPPRSTPAGTPGPDKPVASGERTRLKNANPLIESTPGEAVTQMDYPAHVKTYNQFLRLVKWFCIHMCFLVPALYFFIVQGNALAGIVLLLAGIAVLIYGLSSHPKVARDLDVAFDGDRGR